MAQDIELYKALGLLADLSNELFNDAYGRGAGLPDRISRAGNRFALVSTEGTTDPPNPHALDFAVVGIKRPLSRVYYDGPYNADNPGPPTCRSVDSITPDVDQPQAESCHACRFSNWTSSVSAVSGKPVPACKQHKDLVIKVLGRPGLWLLDIPPDSIRPWDQVVKTVVTAAENARSKKGPPLTLANCVIRAEFAPNRMGTLKFRPMGYLGQVEALAVIELVQTGSATIEQMLWGSPERKAQWEQAAGKTPTLKPLEPPGAPSSPDKAPIPESAKKPPTVAGMSSNGPVNDNPSVKRSRRAPDPRPGTVDTDAALDAIFKDLGIPDE